MEQMIILVIFHGIRDQTERILVRFHTQGSHSLANVIKMFQSGATDTIPPKIPSKSNLHESRPVGSTCTQTSEADDSVDGSRAVSSAVPEPVRREGGQGGGGRRAEGGALSPKKSFQDGEALAKSFVLKKLEPKVEGCRGPSPTNQRVPEGSTRSKRTKNQNRFFFLSLSGRCRAIQLLDTNRKKNRSSADVGAA